jgi:hypothetical protein
MEDPTFANMRSISQNPKLNYTVFLPGPMSAFEKQAQAQCLSLKEWLNEIAQDPIMTAQYVQSFFVRGGAVNSKDFYDGMQLMMLTPGQQPENKLVLGRREV